MSAAKSFDCIEFKRKAQQEYAQATGDFSPQDEIAHLRSWVETSNDPMARLWRRIEARHSAKSSA